ncbi:DUF1203 domain-containing protein [Jannaschia sp. S6380]|uniref:DUF1203 domain-containing protein n=1 Tax=Jannaschia sp. S6380 TaxID=2926408 RepID=UPI001FF2CB69|nr:DUF1203 domain-containing protein [Jannaschia sp. S6380]MCK0167558.1 DUF1203 domain-containing protein [Jannaschia sp. S6380]
MTFQVHPLPYAPFADLFDRSDAELATIGARRKVVAESAGTPCRVSLIDAEPGETVILTNHAHLPDRSPYRATHAIYVRHNAEALHPAPGTLPPVMRNRTLSIRAFDADHMMRGAGIAEGAAVAPLLDRMLADPDIAYIHVHFAAAGCFSARVTRA